MGYDSFLLLAQQAAEPSGVNLANFIPFSILHFLEFAIWGAWYVVLGNYLNAKGFSRPAIGRIYGTMALGAIISPMILGTVADKYLNTEDVIGGSHLIGGVLLLVMSRMNRPSTFFAAALGYALVFSPTLSLVNAIVFEHIDNANNFPYIRVFGTIGWILAGLSLKLLLKPDRPVDNKPILLAAALSFVLGIFAFTLPDTPPKSTGVGAFPALEALGMLAEPTTAVFFAVTLVISMAMGLYFAFGALFIEQRGGVRSENVGPIMTIGQAVEIGFMLSLPWFIRELGMPVVLAVGVTAWALRFAFFTTASTGRYFPLILAGVALHGLCFDFYFAAGFIHVENLADESIRNSSQALFAVVVYGLGMYLGTEGSGWLNQKFTREEAPATAGQPPVRTTDWRTFWLLPTIAVTISLLAFLASLVLVPEAAQPEMEPEAEAAAAAAAELEIP
ncbi:MFS transporter [Tautonia plasticadhaerens]|uniref:Nucleoside transporter YegT n=1 Tax=Tautonia plasticadhaerens TaxID=2527974 RepID=A0A518GYB6_9BACT|nr:MFS transporter [Tautonia plasticadhaerens]QDV33553.1 Putative nucleoside transporter YegT [Tautonia plasticadhaerens]